MTSASLIYRGQVINVSLLWIIILILIPDIVLYKCYTTCCGNPEGGVSHGFWEGVGEEMPFEYSLKDE